MLLMTVQSIKYHVESKVHTFSFSLFEKSKFNFCPTSLIDHVWTVTLNPIK